MSSADPYIALLTSAHNQKPNFVATVQTVCGAIADVTAVIQSIPQSFDLDSAIGAQLDAVGLWIGQSRIISGVLITGFFGFADSIVAKPFGELSDVSIGGRFYELGTPYSGTTVLGDGDFRTVLRARIVRNQADGTIASLEHALAYIFGVPSFITDNGNLTLGLTVASPLTPTDQALLNTLDILPRPAGIRISSITYT